MKIGMKKLFARALSATLSAALLLSSAFTAVTAYADADTSGDTPVAADTTVFDFEDNQLTTEKYKYGEHHSIAAAPATGHGDYSLQIASHSGNTNFDVKHSFLAGHTYHVSYYMYVSPIDSETANSVWYAVWQSDKDSIMGGSTVSSNGGWVEKHEHFVPEADRSFIRFIVGSNTQNVYIDDIVIRDVTNVATNTVNNVDFESGALPSGVSAGGFKIANSPDKTHGNFSLRRTNESTNHFEIKLTTPLKSGHRYKISFDIWAETNTMVCIYNPSALQGWLTYSAKEAWQTHTVWYDATEDSTYITILIYQANCYVDNITVVEDTHTYPYLNTVKNNLKVANDFSDYATSEEAYLYPGKFVNLYYEYDEALQKNVAVATLKEGVGKSSTLAIPYLLKPNRTYKFSMTYKVSAWSCLAYYKSGYSKVDLVGDSAVDNYGPNYGTESFTVTTGDQSELLYIATNSKTGATFSIADYSIEEVKDSSDYPYANQIQDNLYVISDFSDPDNADIEYLMPGSNVTFNYEYDAALGANVAKASFKGNSNGNAFADSVGIPYLLKAGKAYQLQLTLKTDAWICLAFKYQNDVVQVNGNYAFNAGSAYGTKNFTLTPAKDTCIYIGSTVGAPNVSIASYIIKELAGSNTAASQEYDFEHKSPEGSDNYITAITTGKDGKPTEALAFDTTAAATKGEGVVRKFKLDNALTTGKIYKLTYDYKGEANIRIMPCTDPKGWGASAGMYSADKTLSMDFNKHMSSEAWATYSTYFKAESDSTFMYIRTVTFDGVEDTPVNSEFYLDNLKIEEITVAPGDLTGDALVDANDMAALRKLLLGYNEANVIDWAGDVREDDEIDIRDLVRLKKTIAGITDNGEAVSLNGSAVSNKPAALTLSNVTADYNTSLGDKAASFKQDAAEQDAYLVYQLNSGITAASIEYDFKAGSTVNAPGENPGNTPGKYTVSVSNDGELFTELTAQDIACDFSEQTLMKSETAYFSNINYAKYIKIAFPELNGGITRLKRIQLNGITAEVLYSMNGYSSSVREAQTVYVSANGDASSNGLSSSKPTTLEAAFSRTLVPGDKLLLRSGDKFTCTDGIKVTSSGSADKPIVISSYGDGAKPEISGFEDYGFMLTGEYIELSGISFTSPSGKSGIRAYALRDGATRGLSVKNCSFAYINSNAETGDHNRNHGGISFSAVGNNPCWFNGITVENNSFDTLSRGAVFVGTDWSARDTQQTWGMKNLVEDRTGETVYQSENIVIRNNDIKNNSGDAILVIGTKGALIEYNTVKDSRLLYNNQGTDSNGNPRTVAYASIWCHSSDACVMQYNEVSGNSADNHAQDLQAFDIDIACRACVVQYNYSHSNTGGFMLLCAGDSANNAEVSDSIVRYNLSVNDGYRTDDNPLQVFDITGSVFGSKIYNNTVYCGKNTRIVNFANYGNASSPSRNNTFSNNIFYAAENVTVTWGSMRAAAQAGVTLQNSFESAVFRNNAFYNISAPDSFFSGKDEQSRLTVSGSRADDPKLADPKEVDGRDNIKSFVVGNSVLLGAGIAVSDKSESDYCGNTIVPEHPILGAVWQYKEN